MVPPSFIYKSESPTAVKDFLPLSCWICAGLLAANFHERVVGGTRSGSSWKSWTRRELSTEEGEEGNLIKQTQKRYLESGGKHRLCFKNTGGGRNLFERAEAQQQIKLHSYHVAVFWISVRQFQVGLDGVMGCSEHMTLQGPKHHSGSQSTWYLRYSRK